ncbi:MAG: DNA cytosine methyltransferase [Planctomycetes bacterium]|nr:DNA cytosine methyltransferase [Planctomycetota bacterium]
MNVLVGCEYSGVVRDAFLRHGHNAWSCDLLPTEASGPHYQGDLITFLKATMGYWDLGIFHPPCTYTAVSGLHWNKRIEGRAEKTEEALRFVKKLFDASIGKIALEAPVSCISTRIRKPDQIIQPWQFGHDASKKTCLWLKNLPLLKPTETIIKDRYANQTSSGQNKLGPSPDRGKIRSLTYKGIADAMATQWG